MQKIEITTEEFNNLNTKTLVLKGTRPISLGKALFIDKAAMKEQPASINRWEHVEYFKVKNDLQKEDVNDFEYVTVIKFFIPSI